MYFYKHLYVGSSIDDPDEVKKKLRCGAGQLSVYVLMLSPGRNKPHGNQIEFCHCVNLQQPYYKDHPPLIIGIAKGRNEAIDLVRMIVEECYLTNGNADVISYLFPHGIRIPPLRKKEEHR